MAHIQYVHKHRKTWALTQRELAGLLGYQSRSVLSRVELGLHHPTTEFALSCQIIFGERPQSLFPTFYDELEEAVMRRAADFSRAIEGRTGEAAARQRALLSGIVQRIEASPELV